MLSEVLRFLLCLVKIEVAGELTLLLVSCTLHLVSVHLEQYLLVGSSEFATNSLAICHKQTGSKNGQVNEESFG